MNESSRKAQADEVAKQTDERRMITVSVPVFNEEENIAALLKSLVEVADKEAERYRFEFLFTDNASTDRTFELLAAAAEHEPRIRVLGFSRNFGFQKSILTNYLNARGDAAVQIDADLQDPPEIIHTFLREWENGYKVVYGVRRSRKEGVLINLARKIYYRLLQQLSDVDVPNDVGDFRLVDRVILDELGHVHEQTPYLRGLIAGMGFPQIGIPYDRKKRVAGRTKFNLLSLISLGLDGITSQSVRPLRFITYAGLVISVLTLLASLVYLLLFFLSDHGEQPGFTTLVLLVLWSIGLNAFLLGLMGEYVGRIFNNVRGLPISIIERRIEPLASAEARPATGEATNRPDVMKGTG